LDYNSGGLLKAISQSRFVGRGFTGCGKSRFKAVLVAQALLPVRVLLPLSSKHSQEWLCTSTLSAASLAATSKCYKNWALESL
jgi:hypothetical protein